MYRSLQRQMIGCSTSPWLMTIMARGFSIMDTPKNTCLWSSVLRRVISEDAALKQARTSALISEHRVRKRNSWFLISLDKRVLHQVVQRYFLKMLFCLEYVRGNVSRSHTWMAISDQTSTEQLVGVR